MREFVRRSGGSDAAPWVVAGALGRNADRLSAIPELGLARVARRRDAVVVANRRLLPLARRRGWAWNPFDPDVPLRSVDEARRTALAASCSTSGEGWELATDDLGLQPLFYGVTGGTIWFATSPTLLVDVVRSAVGIDLAEAGPDPAGWQSILLTGFPPPGRSAYRSIRTLQPAGAVSVDRNGTVRERSHVAGLSSPTRASVGDLVDALRAAMPVGDPLSLPLSGGWDSRALATLLPPGSDVTAWTTTTDDGTELDIALAPLVARHIGLEHVIYHDPRPTWSELARFELRCSGFQTWYHVWLVPLAAHLGRRPSTVVDGFGGDFILRRLFQRPERDGPFGVDLARDMWTEMGGGRAASDVAWSDEARQWFAGSAFDAFAETAEHLRDHPNWQAQLVMTTRAARCIGIAPTRLLSIATPARMPFVSARVRSILYADGIYEHRGPDLYRAVLARIDGDVAALPSTNDVGRVERGHVARRETSVETLLDLASQVAANPDALRLLSPRLRDAVETGDADVLAKLTRFVVPLRSLQAVFALAQWHLDHPSADRGIWDA